MTTKTLFYPNSRQPQLEIEVTRAGDIVSCLALIPAFDVWVDGMEYLKNRPTLMERAREDAGCLMWNDHGDGEEISLKDRVAEIIGVKHA